MLIEHLSLEHFRLVQAKIDLAPGANLFVGENAQGKTTILEAVSYLSTGRSFRTSRDREVLPHRKANDDLISRYAAAECRFESRGIHNTIRTAIIPTGKSFWANGKNMPKLGDLWGLLNVVIFVPSDVEMVMGGPAGRRALLGALLARTSKFDLEAMQSYANALRQRNALLKSDRRVSPTEYEAYEAQMAEHGTQMLMARQRMVEELAPIAQAQIREFTGGRDRFEMEHESGWPKGSGLTAQMLLEGSQGIEGIRERLRYFWARDRGGDERRGFTEHGPHRGDISLLLNGQDARSYSSQGQARTIVLAIRLAEMEMLERLTGETPVLLLDDVLGELDAKRASRFMQVLQRQGIQSLLTATDATAIEAELPVGARFKVKEGRVKRASVE